VLFHIALHVLLKFFVFLLAMGLDLLTGLLDAGIVLGRGCWLFDLLILVGLGGEAG